jgi:hypothetical protein
MMDSTGMIMIIAASANVGASHGGRPGANGLKYFPHAGTQYVQLEYNDCTRQKKYVPICN